MKIRLMGLPDEVDAVITQIGKVLDIVEVSDAYPNRGNSQLVRHYVEVRLIQPATVTVQREPRTSHPAVEPARAELP